MEAPSRAPVPFYDLTQEGLPAGAATGTGSAPGRGLVGHFRVGPRHGANTGGGNEPSFRPAGEVKNIVYENRGAFNKYYLL